MVPGTYDPATGFYECGWGYTLDSQPDYVINVSEQFDLTGDLTWLRTHKQSCERALDWLLKRDTDGNGLVEMMTDNHADKKSSDWIDVVWASWENALVNAAMYEALTQWSGRERLLGDPPQATRYRQAAEKLRTAFRRPIAQGGFWNEEQGWFAYWRDRDGTTHGNNLVTPVNFSAVAYGLADDTQTRRILDGIEDRMRPEKLFHWPLCFLAYPPDEGGNQAFPDYENGDIFLSWGELAVRSYAASKPTIAVAYVRRVLEQYQKDGLSFQRYLRRDQVGVGDDVLAGNCMTIVGLYRDIYGIRPRWDRLTIDPHLTPELEKTNLRYALRGQRYAIELGVTRSAVTVADFCLHASNGFSVDPRPDGLACYASAGDVPALTVTRDRAAPVDIDVERWPSPTGGGRWTVTCPARTVAVRVTVSGLAASTDYRLRIDPLEKSVRSDAAGVLFIDIPAGTRRAATSLEALLAR